jgi:hypothetical protein
MQDLLDRMLRERVEEVAALDAAVARAAAAEGGGGGGGYGSAFGTPKGRVGGYRRTRIRKHKKSSTKKLRRGQTRRKSN